MNAKILLLALLIAGLGSCTTAYKSSQTPDDVYYSPAPPHEDEIKSEDSSVTKYDNTYRESDEDRDIRVRIRNRRWRNNDYDYSYQPYNNSCCCNDYHYHPYGYYYYNDPKTKSRVTYYPRKYNFNTRNTARTTTVDPKTGQTYSTGSTPTRTQRTGTNLGNSIKRILSKASSSSNNTQNSNDNSTTPVRTFDKSNSNSNSNSSSSSSSSSSNNSSSGGSAPVRTFNK